ncbi:MAG TPA: ATP-binding protein [Acidobacteriota bacterium]|jgi:PAS domain S-box-containing protein
MAKPARKRKIGFDQRIGLLAFLSGVPGSLVALILLWTGGYSSKVEWTLTVFIFCFWLGIASALRHRVVFPLQTLSNLLSALREEDFSIRARGARLGDSLGEVMLEVNTLGETLREQRLGAMEASALVRKVMEEIDIAVFTFDSQDKLQLLNRAGEKLLGLPAEKLLGQSAAALGLAECLDAGAPGTIQKIFPGGIGRWGVRRSRFRERGAPHQLLVLSDLSRALREEENQAWQRLIRVLTHELNNSLTPIKSMAGSLQSVLARQPTPHDWRDDMQRGLAVIETRAESLSRFMKAYARLAKLPQPQLQSVSLGELIRRVAGLETRLNVRLVSNSDLTVRADPDQLEQLLINLVRNAVDASLETLGAVKIAWEARNGHAEVSIEDEGPGLSNTANLFVPFFTTKPEGSGIGLVLSRQIAEAHGGTLTLQNKTTGHGCEARLILPL